MESDVHQTANNVHHDFLRSPVITTNQLHTNYSLWSTNSVDNVRGGSADSFRRHLVLCSGCVLLTH